MSQLIAVIASADRPTQAMLAAEALKKAAATLGHGLSVELHSGGSVAGTATPEAIAAADAVVIAGDDVDEARFAGKKVVRVALDAVLADAAAEIGRAHV